VNPDSIFMLIPLAGMALAFTAIRQRHLRSMAELKYKSGDADLAKVLAKIDRIEQRLAVVEKIATDPTARLADDIERLRDSRV
jgi:hypothetical protein